jgi:hypothetical protein
VSNNNQPRTAFHKLGALLNSPEAWAALEEYLLEQTQQMSRALVAETSELEVRRLQGKLALLATLLKLPSSYEDMKRNK